MDIDKLFLVSANVRDQWTEWGVEKEMKADLRIVYADNESEAREKYEKFIESKKFKWMLRFNNF